MKLPTLFLLVLLATAGCAKNPVAPAPVPQANVVCTDSGIFIRQDILPYIHSWVAYVIVENQGDAPAYQVMVDLVFHDSTSIRLRAADTLNPGESKATQWERPWPILSMSYSLSWE